MVFKFKVPIFNVDAQTAGEVCTALEQSRGLTAEALLDASRPDDSPLHGEFEWRDEIAAEKYRLQQAGTIIRALVIVPEEPEAPEVRAFFNLAPVESGERYYVATATILREQKMSDQLFEQAIKDMGIFTRKYRALQAVAGVVDAMDDVLHMGRMQTQGM
jgi:hypothetical protein